MINFMFALPCLKDLQYRRDRQCGHLHCQAMQASWQMSDTPDLCAIADEQCIQAFKAGDNDLLRMIQVYQVHWIQQPAAASRM